MRVEAIKHLKSSDVQSIFCHSPAKSIEGLLYAFIAAAQPARQDPR